MLKTQLSDNDDSGRDFTTGGEWKNCLV